MHYFTRAFVTKIIAFKINSHILFPLPCLDTCTLAAADVLAVDVATAFVAAIVTAIMLPFFLIIKKLGLMRVSPEVEALGLDVSHHGGSAYPHDKSTSKGDMAMLSPDMVDRKIDEAIARFKRDMGNGDKVE